MRVTISGGESCYAMDTSETELTYEAVIRRAAAKLGSERTAKGWFCSLAESADAESPVVLFRTGRHVGLQAAVDRLSTEESNLLS